MYIYTYIHIYPSTSFPHFLLGKFGHEEEGLGFIIQGWGFRVKASGFGVWGLGCMV